MYPTTSAPRPLAGVFCFQQSTVLFVTQAVAPAAETGVRARLLAAGGGRIDRAEVRRRAGAAMLRELPSFRACENVPKRWAIVGGGPSIRSEVETLRRLKKQGVAVVSVNKSHDCAKRILMDGLLEGDDAHG
jgi:hypothetical protein